MKSRKILCVHKEDIFLFFVVIYLFFIFFQTLFYFTILYWFCHTLTWIHHGCIKVPNPESPSHLPLHIISLDHPHAPAPSILYPVSNIDWQLNLRDILLGILYGSNRHLIIPSLNVFHSKSTNFVLWLRRLVSMFLCGSINIAMLSGRFQPMS